LLLDAVCFPFLLASMVPMLRAAVSGQQIAVNAIGNLSRTLVLFDFVFIFLFIAYNTLMLGRFGATLGDMVIGAVVVTPEGGRITYARALGRTLMKEVSGLILCIGYLIAAFDEQKRTLHDRIAGTVVIAKR
ncbi:MAG: RDD family protein, partial [Terriglobales bacterium]